MFVYQTAQMSAGCVYCGMWMIFLLCSQLLPFGSRLPRWIRCSGVRDLSYQVYVGIFIRTGLCSEVPCSPYRWFNGSESMQESCSLWVLIRNIRYQCLAQELHTSLGKCTRLVLTDPHTYKMVTFFWRVNEYSAQAFLVDFVSCFDFFFLLITKILPGFFLN